MAFASGSNHSMAYIAEVTYGVTPATPVFKPLRHTGTTLGLSKDSLQSEELRSDRQIAAFRHGNKQVGGDVSSEIAYSDFDDMLEAATCGTWAVDTPTAGTDKLTAGLIRRSFTIERHFADINEYIRYTGCEVNSLSLSVAPNAIVTGAFTMIGKDQDPSNAVVAGSTYSASTGGTPFDSFSGSVLEGGVAIGIVTSIDLNIENSIEPNFVVGSATTAGNTIGRSNVTGSVTAYFDSMALMNKFINETSTSLKFDLVSDLGNTLSVELPNVKYGSGQPDVSGDGSITLSLDFQALYDATADTNIVILKTDV